MKRLSLKRYLSVATIVGILCTSFSTSTDFRISPTHVIPELITVALQSQRGMDDLSATEQAFINDYAHKHGSLMRDLFTLFDDYTNPSKDPQYTNNVKAKITEYKKLMDGLKEHMDGCADKNSNFYKVLTKVYAVTQPCYENLEEVCNGIITKKYTIDIVTKELIL